MRLFTDTLASPLASTQRSVKADLAARQFECPPGLECGPGPECTVELCNLPGCADADVCQNSKRRSVAATLVERQGFGCPDGVPCGHGPECAGEFCSLAACADAVECQGYQDKKRSESATLVERQGFGCPDGVPCGHGPECAGDFCSLPACADAEECQGYQDKKRNAIVHPICDICIVGDNGVPVCGCATAGGRNVRRETDRACPLFCITTDSGEELCGCAAEDYEKSLQGGERKA